MTQEASRCFRASTENERNFGLLTLQSATPDFEDAKRDASRLHRPAGAVATTA